MTRTDGLYERIEKPTQPRRLIRLAAVSLAILLGFATSADAANYAITGLARDKRSAIELPLPQSLLAPAPGMPVGGTAMQTGPRVVNTQSGLGGPRTISLPPGVVNDGPVSGGFLIPVPSAIEILTSFNHYGPTASTTLMSGRAGPANFAYCPGAAANPSCTTPAAGGSQGTVNGIIKYTAGPNKFGGTFKLLLSGVGKLTWKGGALPPTIMTSMGATATALPFSGSNVALGGNGFVPGGLSYGLMTTNVLLPSPRTHPYGYMSTPKGLLTRGPIVGAGASSLNTQTAFPMTTGVVYVYAKLGAQVSKAGVPSKVTSSGYDHRTEFGAGRIQLIGGALGRPSPSDGSNPAEGSVLTRVLLRMTFTPQPALPLSSPAALVSLGALVFLSAGFALRRRAASSPVD